MEIKFAEEEINFESEKQMPIYYHQKLIGIHNLDFLIEEELILELKTADEIHKKYYAKAIGHI